ncbi:MAG: chemotaxis protein CheW [Candidatus Omnitrophota bacterium]
MSQVNELQRLVDEKLQLVCFKLANEEYAIDITRIQEVIKIDMITPIPQLPEFLLGIVNVRGNIVPVFDLRKLYGIGEKAFDEKSRLLILRYNGKHVSIVVDEILDTMKLDKKMIDPPPAVGMKIKGGCVKGLGMLDQRIIIILELDPILQEINESIHHFSGPMGKTIS